MVTTRLFIFSRVTISPLSTPTPTPTSSMMTIATPGGYMVPNPPKASSAINSPPTMAVRPMLDSDERSKWPVSIVKDWPITNMPTAATRGMMPTRFDGSANRSDRREKAARAIRTSTQIRLSSRANVIWRRTLLFMARTALPQQRLSSLQLGLRSRSQPLGPTKLYSALPHRVGSSTFSAVTFVVARFSINPVSDSSMVAGDQGASSFSTMPGSMVSPFSSIST